MNRVARLANQPQRVCLAADSRASDESARLEISSRTPPPGLLAATTTVAKMAPPWIVPVLQAHGSTWIGKLVLEELALATSQYALVFLTENTQTHRMSAVAYLSAVAVTYVSFLHA